MTPFEEELNQALRRQEPAADFTARVLARCAEEDAKSRAVRWHMFWTAPSWRLGAIAAALLIAAGGTAYQQHEREVRGLAAKRKLLLAVRVAGSKLQEVEQRVADSLEAEQQ
jgi:hypothetical protein